ncbi:xanthine dehydrogenase family protein subunit M [Nonomuraea sp. NPDC003709]|uniref:FAD binding domain-containing protein n=1 Tax=unclassified Nonomuraea TaxID=2593643 RepID=UPI00339FD792
MREFEYVRAGEVGQAVATVTADPDASYLAGGTTQIDLMKDGVLEPDRLVDITRLPLAGVARDGDVLRVGALTTMEELAADPTVTVRLPFLREALLLGASVQLRNMATIGGNLLQRTRCRYFRDPTVPACNKRHRGSGCAAVQGAARMHAILGASEHCIAVHASDMAVPLVALHAVVHLRGTGGERSVPLTEFYRVPGDTPDVENVLTHGELITAVDIPLLPPDAHSTYLKIRDRVSYEFALTSAAVALRFDGGVIGEAHVALGGVGTIPWHAPEAEQALRGLPPSLEVFTAAAEAAVRDPFTVEGTAFKVELAKRTLVRALRTAAGGAS